MAVLLLTYDLNKEGQNKGDYDEFYKVRDTYDFLRLSESSYALYTNDIPQTVWAKLQPYTDENDTVLVIHLRPSYSGQGSQTQVDWLAQRLTI